MPKVCDQAPLCVDLDGALVHADLSLESLLRMARCAPWALLLVPFWLIGGKSWLKARLAGFGGLRPELLPYNTDVLDLIRDARAAGRRIVLVTGSNRALAESISAHLELFDELHASDDRINLVGLRKAQCLVERFGSEQFDYVGNGAADLAVWAQARAIVIVGASARTVRRARALGKPLAQIAVTRPSLPEWLRCVRAHQWAKNALVLVPLLTAHVVPDADRLTAAALSFLSFCLLASATYIINDLLDLDADRAHRTKRLRPIAAGRIPLPAAGLLAFGLLASGLASSLLLPQGFSMALLVYLVATLLYSFRFKRVASLDILVLAGLYTMRIIAGGLAVGVEMSFWLLACSMFVFLCLAIVKRVAELLEIDLDIREGMDAAEQAAGREYNTGDLAILQALGASSGYLAVLVLALYINSVEVSQFYRTPELLWLVVPLALLWITHIWITTARGAMQEDPVVFAIKDPKTWMTGALAALIVAAAAILRLEVF